MSSKKKTTKKTAKKPAKKIVKKTADSSSTSAETPKPGSKAEELQDRREKVERMKLRGYTNDQIATMFSYSVRQVGEDLAAIRARNAENYRGTANLDEEAAMVLAKYENAQAELWTAHANATGTHATASKIQAISAVVMTLRDQVKLLQALGRLPKEALSEEERRPVNVYFNIKRPDRSKQLADQAKGQKK